MLPDPDTKWLRRFRRNLGRWYENNARDLPWRRTRDPYAIWISEIMLQQTTVVAVVPYFERFLQRFPTVHQLAAAPESDVLRLWEGLGYYSRARNIHRAAQQIVRNHHGEFPPDPESLQKLPGIGRYTAGAIASFAFDRKAPIVEANTLRLYSRLLGYRGDPRSADGQEILWSFADRVLPSRSAGRMNQALMELGATVCRHVDPDCANCPVRSCCRALADGAQHEIPKPKVRPAVTEVIEATVAIRRRGKFLLRRRNEKERWAGLWDFPRFALENGLGEAATAEYGSASVRQQGLFGSTRDDLQRLLESETGIRAEIRSRVTEIRHGVTRFRIHLLCFLAEHRGGRAKAGSGQRWVSPEEFPDLPFSMTGRKFADLLSKSV